jgi:hypothetical protein
MLNNFKWYRKLCGGVWYKYQTFKHFGFPGSLNYIVNLFWSKNNYKNDYNTDLKEIENYNKKQYKVYYEYHIVVTANNKIEAMKLFKNKYEKFDLINVEEIKDCKNEE